MTLYYAMGGGLGHVCRAKELLKYLGIETYKVLTASPFAEHFFQKQNIIQVPSALAEDSRQWKNWLEDVLSKEAFTEIFLDVFPAGIMGEWSDLNVKSGIKFFCVARRIKWKEYLPVLSLTVCFEKTYVLEELEEAHESFLQENSSKMVKLVLPYKADPIGKTAWNSLTAKKGQEIWLIVHSEPAEEVLELLNYARDIASLKNECPFLLVVSALELKLEGKENTGQISFYPANALFPYADKIFSAAGFNIMQQMRPYRNKHQVLPFPRKYDDQFWRARKLK